MSEELKQSLDELKVTNEKIIKNLEGIKKLIRVIIGFGFIASLVFLLVFSEGKAGFSIFKWLSMFFLCFLFVWIDRDILKKI